MVRSKHKLQLFYLLTYWRLAHLQEEDVMQKFANVRLFQCTNIVKLVRAMDCTFIVISSSARSKTNIKHFFFQIVVCQYCTNAYKDINSAVNIGNPKYLKIRQNRNLLQNEIVTLGNNDLMKNGNNKHLSLSGLKYIFTGYLRQMEIQRS